MLLDQDFDCSTFVGNTDYNCNTFLLFKYVSFTKVHLIFVKQHGILLKQEIQLETIFRTF